MILGLGHMGRFQGDFGLDVVEDSPQLACRVYTMP